MRLSIPYIASIIKTSLQRAYRSLQSFGLWLLLIIFGRNIKLATSWNELTEKQLKEISFALEHHARTIGAAEEKALQHARLYIRLVKNLLRENNWVKVWIALRQIPPAEYSEHLHFIKNVTRTKFLPAFQLKNKTYHPPLDRLQNITIKEFSFADSLYYAWRKTKDTRYLDLLCATLYRPADFKNDLDVRTSFNKILIEQEVAHFSALSLKKKTAIAYTYEGSRNYIVNLYPTIFPPPPAPAEGEKKILPAETRYTPFGKLLQHKIQYDPSKLERTQQLNLHEFLSTYENELQELKSQK